MVSEIPSNADLNSIATGIKVYWCSNSSLSATISNKAVDGSDWMLLSIRTTGYGFQFFVSMSGHSYYLRDLKTSVWSAWRLITIS